MRRTLLLPPALCLALFLVPFAARGADRLIPSALDIFRLLPTSVFENTPEGLSDEEKQTLIRSGRTSLWRLLPLDTDELKIESLPVSGSEVTIRLFHEREATVAAVGAESRDGCAVELWRLDAQNRLVPYPLPPEPATADFFAPLEPPAGIKASMLFCLSGTVLRSHALFTGPQGEDARVRPRNIVFYRWTGAGFEKAVIPVPPEPAPPQASPAPAP